MISRAGRLPFATYWSNSRFRRVESGTVASQTKTRDNCPRRESEALHGGTGNRVVQLTARVQHHKGRIQLEPAIGRLEGIHDVIRSTGHIKSGAAAIPQQAVVGHGQIDLLFLNRYWTSDVIDENPFRARRGLPGG